MIAENMKNSLFNATRVLLVILFFGIEILYAQTIRQEEVAHSRLAGAQPVFTHYIKALGPRIHTKGKEEVVSTGTFKAEKFKFFC